MNKKTCIMLLKMILIIGWVFFAVMALTHKLQYNELENMLAATCLLLAAEKGLECLELKEKSKA